MTTTRTRAGRAACALPVALGLLAAPAAHAQDAFFPNNATVNYAINGTANVGYANQNDLNAHTNGTSPTVTFVSGSSNSNLEVYNSSKVNITGGTFSNENTFDNATVTISGGTVAAGSNSPNATVNVTGGTVGLNAYGGTVNISGGQVNAGINNFLYGTVVNISGGNLVHGLDPDGSGAVTISGGTFGTFSVDGNSNDNVNLFNAVSPFGGSFTLVGSGLTATSIGRDPQGHGADYLLTGLLHNGGNVNGDILLQVDGVPMFTLQNVPPAATPEPSQPAALGLGALGLAGLTLRARRRTPA